MAKTTEDMLSKIVDKLDELQKSTHSIDKEVALQKAASVERHMDIKQIQEEQKRSNDILQENTNSLNEHMARTELLEQMYKEMDQRLTPIEIAKIEQDAISKNRKETIIKVAKVIGALATLCGMLVAAKPLLLFLLTL